MMDNIVNRNIDKGVRLMEEAIRCFSDGNNSAAYASFVKAGQCIREACSAENGADGASVMRYGDNLNFGALYKVFESNASGLYRSEGGRRAIAEVVSLINGNKVLKEQFAAYNAFTNPENVGDVSEYVSEAVSIMPRYPKDVLRENNRKLMEAIRRNGLDESVEVSEDEQRVFEGVEYMMTHMKDFRNLSKFNGIQSSLCEFVGRHNRTVEESEGIDEKYHDKVNEVVSKYEGVLNEDEIELIRNARDPKAARRMFESLKGEVVGELEKLCEGGSDSESWKAILEKVESKEFSEATALQDIAELAEVKGEITE